MPYSALAELSGVSQPALQRLLTGKVDGPSLTSISAVARVLGMGAVQFMDDGSIKFDSTVSVQALRAPGTKEGRVDRRHGPGHVGTRGPGGERG